MKSLPIALMIAATGFAGCASTPPPPAAALPGTAACIFATSLRDWQVLDNQTLLVHAPMGNKPYLIKLFAPVTTLAYQETLAFEDGDHNDRLCSTGDSVLVGGSIPDRSPIAAVRLLTPEEARSLVASYRKS
ncbi:MAG TPA: DUF6491 family protein [Steroidobacteraceae bacterium]|nr:DUF6491 family protein [Steroidobacteraceae bacterium]